MYCKNIYIEVYTEQKLKGFSTLPLPTHSSSSGMFVSNNNNETKPFPLCMWIHVFISIHTSGPTVCEGYQVWVYYLSSSHCRI